MQPLSTSGLWIELDAPYVIGLTAAALLLIVVAVVWALVFRAAMRNPNNGNEFSRDEINGGE